MRPELFFRWQMCFACCHLFVKCFVSGFSMHTRLTRNTQIYLHEQTHKQTHTHSASVVTEHSSLFPSLETRALQLRTTRTCIWTHILAHNTTTLVQRRKANDGLGCHQVLECEVVNGWSVCLCVCVFDGVRPQNSTVCVCVCACVCVCQCLCMCFVLPEEGASLLSYFMWVLSHSPAATHTLGVSMYVCLCVID